MSAPLLALPVALRRRWRRSLALRVVSTTLLLSAVVSVLLGVTILRQVRDGLLGAAARSATGQLATGLTRAQSQFAALPRTDPASVERTAYVVVADLSGRSGQQDYDVVMLASSPGLRSYAPAVDTSSIPASLRRVVAGQGRQAWTYSDIVSADGARQPGLVVGAPIEVGGVRYELYYLFPLTREAQAIGLVERTMIFAGAALVLLLAGIVGVVTRQVVRPVRQAAASAQRLAAGDLADRMPVRGEDDLATLATSFNGMADTVQDQISQLRELSRMQRRFVADVSHELRTPVTTIRMAADLLHASRHGMPPDLDRTSELLQAQLDRFERLLGDLLEISRYDAGAAVLDAEPLDLGPLVDRVVESASVLAARRGTRVETDLPATPTIVEVDPRRIDRVLRNLVDNAVEHAEGSPVHVVLRGGERSVCVTVSDAGIGLRPGEASLVFGRFWRADPARTRSTGGSGLGLSIALEDVRLHGGWLQAWGEPGRGAVFRMTLPWRVGDDPADPPLPLDPDEPSRRQGSIRHGDAAPDRARA